jgi:glutaminyl-tRNA synthetase
VAESLDFVRAMVADDLKTGKHGGRVVTRFPPEPNGYLHIGHAKAICLNFGLALENEGGVCHLRFDDTNPEGEDIKFVEAIETDVRWLGFDWGENLFHASDYFEKLYDFAVTLIENGRAYVDSQSLEEIRRQRGSVTEPGTEGPHRNRSVEENLDLFRRMRDGEFADGEHVLRAKGDMAAKNMVMRDPVLYRIRHATHYRAGDAWCVYPLYDFTHCLSDAIENITHSLCSLEFKDNRELYDWVLEAAGTPQPRPEQTEFARLNVDYTVLSKRKLVQLVGQGLVDGWDDPRMPTIAGLRRRGVTPEAIRAFCDMIGLARVDSRVDIGKLEFAIRDDLNKTVPRVMCVLRPLKVVIVNYPEDQVEKLDAPYYPHDVPKEGSRKVPFARELYIEADDFLEDPPKKFFRLAPGREVRLRYAYFIKCVDVIKDETGAVTELHCTYDHETKGGDAPDGRKVKGTLHWVAAREALPAEIRLYDRLFVKEDPDEVEPGKDFTSNLNPDSKLVLRDSRIEPSVVHDPPGSRYQFERQGYFCSDAVDSRPDALVFNRTVGLRDTWAKVAAEEAKPAAGTPRTPRRKREASPAAKAPESQAAASPEHAAAAERYLREFGLSDEQAKVLASDESLATIFGEATAVHDNPKGLASWIVGDVSRNLRERKAEAPPVSGEQIGSLVALIDDGTISRAMAKDVLAEMLERGGHPGEIVERRGLRVVSDRSAIEPIIAKLITQYPDKVEAYRGGRTGLLGFFVGQAMKETGGRADPEVVKDTVLAQLS